MSFREKVRRIERRGKVFEVVMNVYVICSWRVDLSLPANRFFGPLALGFWFGFRSE